MDMAAEITGIDSRTGIVEYLATSLEHMMYDIPSTALNCCIFKVPKSLYRHNERAYVPNAFSFGPFHYQNEQLQPTQGIKLKCLQCILGRSQNPNQKLRELINAISEIEGLARECYEGQVMKYFNVEEFIKILLLDSCFIVELFRNYAGELPEYPDNPFRTTSSLLESLNHDLILLENQSPWLVLEQIFTLTKTCEHQNLVELTLDFFSDTFPFPSSSISLDHYFSNEQIYHILDLLRLSLILPLGPNINDYYKIGLQPFPSAAAIKASGIKFKRKSASKSILDIKFIDGVLEIPPLLIQETTETLFRNLISFEQCHPNIEPRITSYAKLMDSLVNNTRDLEILGENKIIDNCLNPEDAIRFFNKIFTDAYLKSFYYHKLYTEMNSYRERSWPKWRFFYLQNFGSPWAIVSQLVAAMLFMLSFLQTVYTIIGGGSAIGK